MRIERKKILEGELIFVINEKAQAKCVLSSLGAGIYEIEYLGKKVLHSPASLEEYLSDPNRFGKMTGPFAESSKNQVEINGKSIAYDAASFDIYNKVFDVAVNEDRENGYYDVIFTLKTPKTPQFPAQIEYSIVYSFAEGQPRFAVTTTLESNVKARFSLSNRLNFNLGEKDISSLRLSIPSTLVGVFDEERSIKAVGGVNVLTDFRDGILISRHQDDPELRSDKAGYDHCYKLEESNKPIVLESEDIALFISTTEPSLSLSSSNLGVALVPNNLLEDGLSPSEKKRIWHQSVYSFFDKNCFAKLADPALSVSALVRFAIAKGFIGESDFRYFENMLLHRLKINEPYSGDFPLSYCLEDLRSPDLFLKPIEDRLVEIGYEKAEAERELCFLLGMLTPRPSEVEEEFNSFLEQEESELATEYLYNLSVNAGYVEKNKVDRNIVFDARFEDGPSLELSINLSKPEKDNKEIAKLVGAKKSGYPACVLCYDNIGYGGSPTHPARGNVRFVPILLDNSDWYLQFSPYGYFKRHCIAFSKEHVPMAISEKIFRSLFDFVDLFPHYFVGSNSDLPLVGGSILNHEHFQAGEAILPLLKAPIKEEIHLYEKGVNLFIVDFYNTALLLQGKDKEKIIALAEKIRFHWRIHDDPELDILSHTGDTPHNTLTPILRKNGDIYSLYVVLRNNRCDERYPNGIFCAHPEFAHIKSEAIGLIEASGLFVLPPRLIRQSKILEEALRNGVQFTQVKAEHPDMGGFQDMYDALKKGEGKQSYMGRICRKILDNTSVYKKDENGMRGLKAFLMEVTR